MPRSRRVNWAGSGSRGRPGILAALIALAIAAAAPPTAAAATSAGQLYAFGSNRDGELGNATNNETTKANPTPALVGLPGASGPVTQVAAGGEHSLALTSTGQLYAFGSNHFGQLGIASNSGTLKPNPTPNLVTLPGASGPVTQVAAGRFHSLALTSPGQLYAFGLNGSGELGIDANIGTEEPNPTPALVTLPNASGPVTQIAAGGAHSLAVTSTGQLYAFGSNYSGQLGNTTNGGTEEPNPTPALISLPGASGPVVQIAAGADHSLAVTSTGQLYAFGLNEFGQLGSATNNGTMNPNPTPTLVTLPTSDPVTQVAAGYAHSLALTSSGQLFAFGSNYYGQLGSATHLGSVNPNPALITLPGANGRVVQIAAADHSLAVTSSGQLFAFGSNHNGQLGSATNNETENANPTPTSVDVGAGKTIDTVASGPWSHHTLAVIANLALRTGSLPSGRVGTPYGTSASAEGGTAPYTWRASGLPAGLTIDSAGGQISGTPTEPGTAQVTLSVSDRFGVVAQSTTLTLRIESAAKAAQPTISKLRQSHSRWREGRRLAKVSSAAAERTGGVPLGTTFSFKLNTKATVRLAFTEQEKGRKSKRSAKGTLSFMGHSGTNRVAFQGLISRNKRLRRGPYKLTVTASAGGSRSKPRSLRFTIVR
jgi:alpha-tubulin suppressor-like RCC1 family protein